MANYLSLKGASARLIVGLLTTLCSLFLIIASYEPWVEPLFFGVLFALMGQSFLEYERICELKGFQPEKWLSLFLSLLYLLSLKFAPKAMAPLLPLLFLFASLLSTFLLLFYRNRAPLSTAATTLFGLIYILFPIATLYQIDYLLPEVGPLWLLYLVVVVKLSDTVAFFVGSKIGKRPIAPYISPKKSVEGSLGGLLGSLVGSVAFHFFAPGLLSFYEAVGLGLLLGLLAQLGDLSESLLKREALIKDSGSLPGLGGVLDIMDSLLFASPALLIYLLL